MSDFANPFCGMSPDRKLTPRELSRAIRMAMAAELEAIHMYEALADATEDPLAAKVFQDVANEEREHVGEFGKLLELMLDDENVKLQHGAKEVLEMRDELRQAGLVK